ncbi:MAG: glutamate synthase subunit alpha, partial [Candidatus Omnitrophica bacterium]|nr:glutamate synthase subunit alpha [Candidatus Omnitrophota bacterium]
MREEIFLRGLSQKEFEKSSCGVGFICDLKGRTSHNIIKEGIFALENLLHRGAVGADPKTGDGAGILIGLPDRFLRKEADKNKIRLPKSYAVGMLFLPRNKKEREFCETIFRRIIKQEGLIFLGLREVPVDSSFLGRQAKNTQPVIKHIFIGREKNFKTKIDFERRLYLVRRRVENLIRKSKLTEKSFFYITNLSCRTLSYKGLLMSNQLKNFFLDLKDPALESPFCLFHARYSTNTFPTWDLAQPFRYLAHNGEINTLRGNINWFNSRQGTLKSRIWKRRLKALYPIIIPGGSDSATIDNVLEFLLLSGRSIIES